MEDDSNGLFFWAQLIEILKKQEKLKNVNPKSFCEFVESLIVKYN